jgi:hypothetical protein
MAMTICLVHSSALYLNRADSQRSGAGTGNPALRVAGPAPGVVTLAEHLRYLITGLPAVLAAILAVETTFSDGAAALGVCAFCLGHNHL